MEMLNLKDSTYYSWTESQGLRTPATQILQGSCLDRLKELDTESIDAIVTDPPYELGFMNKGWDKTGIAYNEDLWAECLRVLKPGGHLIAFGGSRTIHRISCAIENGGFEIRDMINWLYFSGFPKSLNVAKAIDSTILTGGSSSRNLREAELEYGTESYKLTGKSGGIMGKTVIYERKYKELQTEEAKEWRGWGTALKPAYEPACLARKPIQEGSIAKQVLKTRTGALNIDGSRFAYGDPCWVGPNDKRQKIETNNKPNNQHNNFEGDQRMQKNTSPLIIDNWSELGRWPANIYQCVKAQRAERDQGLDHLESKTGAETVERKEGSAGLNNPRAGAGRTSGGVKNYHPTVKPIDLMRWLVKLVTPPGGIVLDPFSGSGTTLAAATLEGFDSIGVELNPGYIQIIEGRVRWARDEYFIANRQLQLPW